MGDLILGVILQYMVSASFSWLVKGKRSVLLVAIWEVVMLVAYAMLTT